MRSVDIVPVFAMAAHTALYQQLLLDKTREVIERGIFIMGQEHDAFEKEFANYIGSTHALGVGNGTDALEIALRAVGCEEGDEVITTANAGFYSSSAIISCGAIPVFVDIAADTLTTDVTNLEAMISPKTRAIIVTHLYGCMADVSAAHAIARKHAIALIEDCAQAHGAVRNGKKAGSFGDIGCFSFYPTKNLGAVGDGGALTTSNNAYAERIRQLRQYGWNEKYQAGIPHGRNSRLDELQAAFLRIKLPHLDESNRKRRDIVAAYRAALGDKASWLQKADGEDYVAHLCVMRHPEREAFRSRMLECGVQTAVHYPICDHMQQAISNVLWRGDMLSITEAAAKEVVTLPCSAEMTGAQIEQVCRALKESI